MRRVSFVGNYATSPDWSPRGNRIVFTALVDGTFQLFLLDPATGDPLPDNHPIVVSFLKQASIDQMQIATEFVLKIRLYALSDNANKVQLIIVRPRRDHVDDVHGHTLQSVNQGNILLIVLRVDHLPARLFFQRLERV